MKYLTKEKVKMNFKELKQKLIDRKVPEEMYYFGDRMPD